MTEIQDYVQQLSTRSRYKKVFYKTQDATSVRLLDTQLMHAFQIFSVCAVCLTEGIIPNTQPRE